MQKRLSFLCAIIFCVQCASLTTPTGGPKDKIPPLLLESVPKANQTNFKAKTVELSFDETVKLNNAREEIIISPSPGKEIEIKTKGSKVTITPRGGWKDTTTYSISFREGIQDITESNSPPNLKLAFSTGPQIDSLHLSGNVYDLLEGVPREKITVAIYQADTFDIFIDSPNYFTKTDKHGNFKLENIHAGTYRIYAFDDKNKNLKVESRNEMYGFIARSIKLTTHVDTLDIGLFRLDSRPFKLTSARNIGNITRLRFNKYVDNYSVESSVQITHAFGDNQTDVTIWNPENGDSVRLHLSATDSLQNKIDTSFYIKKTAIKPIKEKFSFSLGTPTVDPETGKFTTTLKFNKPISIINFDSLFIGIDSVNHINISKHDMSLDTAHGRLTLSKELNKKIFTSTKDPQLFLKAGRGFLYSVDSDSSKELSAAILIYWPEENAILSFQTQTKEKNYVIQIIDKNSKQIIFSVANLIKVTVKNLPPSAYQLRVIVDSNRNGRWDPGNIKINQQPEKIIYYKAADGSQSFPVRANWELGPLLLRF